MATIQKVIDSINERVDLTDKTKKIYIKKFQKIIEGCNDKTFLDKFNDIEHIKNVYLHNMSYRTKLTYIGEIFAIHYSYTLFTKANFDKLEKYRNQIRDENDEIMQTPSYEKNKLVYKEPINTIIEKSIVDNDSDNESDEDITDKQENKYIKYIDTRQIYLKEQILEMQKELEKLIITKEQILKIEMLI